LSELIKTDPMCYRELDKALATSDAFNHRCYPSDDVEA